MLNAKVKLISSLIISIFIAEDSRLLESFRFRLLLSASEGLFYRPRYR